MVRYYFLKNQPEIRYAAGYAISREGNLKEWTPLYSDGIALAKDWERWRKKALDNCRWKNATELILINDKWAWVIEE